MHNSVLKIPQFGGTFGGKIKILITHNLLSQIFGAVCRKIVTSCPPRTFLTHDAAGRPYIPCTSYWLVYIAPSAAGMKVFEKKVFFIGFKVFSGF